jgi:hypothetical protein
MLEVYPDSNSLMLSLKAPMICSEGVVPVITFNNFKLNEKEIMLHCLKTCLPLLSSSLPSELSIPASLGGELAWVCVSASP